MVSEFSIIFTMAYNSKSGDEIIHLKNFISETYDKEVSGAGAKQVKELALQNLCAHKSIEDAEKIKELTALELSDLITKNMRSGQIPIDTLLAPLSYSLLPYIDKEVDFGQSREEWKGDVEANKILGNNDNGSNIHVDGKCVRVGVLRSHSQGLTIKLKKDISVNKIEEIIGTANDWVKVIPNNKADTLNYLSPANVSGTLNIHIGRIRKMKMGEEYLTAFTVGDQLLWGAAEPFAKSSKDNKGYSQGLRR